MALEPQPDPNAGLFETLLVAKGRPVELDSHIARLSAGLEDLFGVAAPPGARESAIEHAKAIHLGRVRLTAAPNGEGGFAVDVVVAEVAPELVFPSWERAVTLRSLVAEGGLGAHKWADRAFLERGEAAAPAGSVPLLLDADGDVLEASRASVFAVSGRALRTPPTDGRILPGIARFAAIEIAVQEGIEVREDRLTMDDLVAAEEVFLTGSVRGVEPVKAIDGARIPPTGEIGKQIATGLRRRWLG